MTLTQTSLDPEAIIARVEREVEEAQQHAVVLHMIRDGCRREARSPRGEVSLAVDTSGRLTALDLTDGALELPAPELAALILSVAASAQKRAARAAIALSEVVFGAEAGVVGQLRGGFEARVGDLSGDEETDGGPMGVRW